MSSTVLKNALLCASLAFAFPAMAAKVPKGTLSCEIQSEERPALKQAPKGVRRVSKHVLEIKLDGRAPQRFVDEPPYDDESGMDGVRWRYCGFDAQMRAHLISKVDGSFSGQLVMEDTGQRLHAGHTVVFAPTGTAFLAIEQESGRDGGSWAVRDMRGKAIWEGYGGLLAKTKGEENIVSFFEQPGWNERGQLTARYACLASERSGVVTLVRAPSGKWQWRGHGKCE